MLRPPTSSNAPSVRQITIAVPRSGSTTTRQAIAPASTISGRTPASERTRRGSLEIKRAAYRTKASLATSEGWN
jgi:hypothetical protein